MEGAFKMSEQKNTTVVDNTTENVTPNTDVQANPGPPGSDNLHYYPFV